MTHNIKAMLVMAQERRSTLVNALETCGFDVLPACDCNEARRMLETQPLVQVVVTDARLHDGDWRRVLEIVEQRTPQNRSRRLFTTRRSQTLARCPGAGRL
jgi:CheY-like chemotaxis protein